MRSLITCTFFLAAASGIAGAHTDQEIQKCAAISNAAERLFCFDSLAAQAKAPASAGERATAARAATPAGSTGPAPSQVQQQESFGLEMQQARDSADEINSRFDGSFNGWDGSTVFTLENGQVWKQAESGRLSLKVERPMITIKRGWFGAYYLNVEGANKSIRVKRVK